MSIKSMIIGQDVYDGEHINLVKYKCSETADTPPGWRYIYDKQIRSLLTKRHNIMISYMKPTKLYHVSNIDIKNINSTFVHSNLLKQYGVSYNPTGLWVSCGSSWQKYARSNTGSDFEQYANRRYTYEIVANIDTVLKIKTITDFLSFIESYKYPDNIITMMNVINWKKVRKDYSGLIICPYLGNKIWGKNANSLLTMGTKKSTILYYTQLEKMIGPIWKTIPFFLAEWYRHWEVASGVIWKKTGIADFKLIADIGDLYVNA